MPRNHVLAALAAALAAACLPTVSRADRRVVVAGPMSGEQAVFGAEMVAGARQAIADINAAGGVAGQPVKLAVEDDACDPKQAVAVANRVAARGADLVAGHFCSSSSVPASKVYIENGILDISPSTASARFTDEGAWNIFRVCGRDDQQGRFAGHTLATEFRDRAVALIHDNSTFGKGIVDAIRAEMAAEGKIESFYGAYTPADTDFTALVSRLKQARAEVVYFGGYFRAAGLIMRQAHEQGFVPQFLGSTTMQTKALWQVGGDAVEGFRHTFYADPATRPQAAHAVAALRAQHVDPGGFTLFTYAVVQVWAEAANKVGSVDPKTVSAMLKTGGPWSTVIGAMAFDEKGDPKNPVYAWYGWHAGGYAPL